MTTETPNISSHPPIWRWMERKSQGTRPGVHSAPKAHLRAPFPRWRNRRRPLWCEFYAHPTLKGVAVVRARGWEFQFPEDVSLLEALLVVNGLPPARNL